MYLKFGFVIFLEKRGFGAKAESKMLVKLTKGVNFSNILHKPFLYESALKDFSLITVWLCNFLPKEYGRKSCS